MRVSLSSGGVARITLAALFPFLCYLVIGAILHEGSIEDRMHGVTLDLPADAVVASGNRRTLNQYKEIPWAPPDVIPTTNVPSSTPRLVRTEWYTQGPVDPANILASVPSQFDQGSCLSIGDTLLEIGATMYYNLLQDAGLKTVILDPKDVQATLLVPVDESFFYEIDASPLREEKSIDELTYYAPELRKPLAGTSILKGLWPSDSFGNGMRIPTSNNLGMSRLHVIVKDTVPPKVDADNRKMYELHADNGNSAEVLVKDIVTCGPSIIHVVSNVLLPFSFDDKPIDVTQLLAADQG